MGNRNFIIAVVILVAVGVVGITAYFSTRFDKSGKISMSDFPMVIGDWQATDIPLSQRDYEILETKNLIMREYKNKEGDSIHLYIVYSENNRRVTHPPELCLTGDGLTIIDKSSVRLTNTLQAVRLLTEKGEARELVVYWFRAGSLNTDRYIKQQLKVLFDLLFGKSTSCAMIRISAHLKENNQQAALELIKSFCVEIEPLLVKYAP